MKKPSPSHYNPAFSLVEMSIVLVIIGLLVGGLVVGRSFIKNAELSTMMNEAKFYMNSFGQFQIKYNKLWGGGLVSSNYRGGCCSQPNLKKLGPPLVVAATPSLLLVLLLLLPSQPL